MEKSLQELHSADAQLESEDRWHKVKLAMQAPAKGAASLGALLGDALLAPAHFAMPDNIEMPEQIKGMPMSRGLANLGEQPKTQGEKYGQAVLEGAGGGMVGSASRLGRNAFIGAVAGGAGEAGGQATNDNPVARVASAIAGGMLGAKGVRGADKLVGNAVKPNVESLARATMGDVSEEDLADAVARMRGWQGEGFKGTAAQAVDAPSNLDKLQELLASHPSGKETQAALRAQPESIVLAGDQAVARTGGNIQSMPAVANAAQDTATKAIDAARQQASMAWRQTAGQTGESIPSEVVAALDKRLSQLAKDTPQESFRGMVEDARKALRDPNAKAPPPAPALLDQFGRPAPQAEAAPAFRTNALAIKEDLEDRLSNFGARELNMTGTDAKMVRKAQEVRSALGEILGEHAPQLKAADAAYNTIMTDLVDPLKKSAVGQLAGRRGAQDDVQAPIAKLQGLFERGTTSQKASDIRYVASVLNKEDPTVFPDAVATWMGDKLAHLPIRESEQQFSPETAAMVRNALFGSPAKAQGVRDMLAGVADAQGRKPEELVRGFERYMDLVDAAAKRPASVGGVTAGELKDAAGKSKTAEALRLVSFFAPAHVATGFAGFTSRRVLADIDKLFTTPEGLETLAFLSKTPPGGKLSEDLLTSFRAATATSQPTEGQ
jgi:hypothetical protein